MVLSDAAFLQALQVGTVQIDLTEEPLVRIRIFFEGREEELYRSNWSKRA
jgi:hypothetical protein